MKADLIETLKMKASELCRQPLDLEQSLWSTSLLDSLARVELAFYVSELTGIEIEPEDVCPENFESIEHVLRFIERKGQT